MTFTIVNSPTEAKLLACVRCGLCLQHCPTYRVTGLETESPRGRVFLIRALAENKIAVNENFRAHIDLCLGCLNCETACPSGVPYGRLLESARAEIVAQTRFTLRERFIRWLTLKQIFPHPKLLAFSFSLLSFYQRLGIQRLVRATGLLKLFGNLREVEALLPERKFSPFRSPTPVSHSTNNAGGKPTVALFTGCIMRAGFGPMHDATIRVLEKNGYRVTIPNEQICCGALHAHAGERKMARKNIDAFEKEKRDVIAINAVGCGAQVKEYGHLLADDPRYAARAKEFVSRARDLSEILAAQPLVKPTREVKLRVTYQEPCHLAHAQKIRNEPRQILKQIPGIEFVEMLASDRCCGSAGIYNVLQPEMANTLLEEKIQNTRATNAKVVVTGNIGCLMQMDYGARKFGYRGRILHWVELLDEAYNG